MSSIQTAARRVGALYFVFAAIAIIREFFFPAFVVPGDAAATAHNITSAVSTYRIALLIDFVTLVIFIYLVQLLHDLLAEAGKTQAMLMVLLVVVGVGLALANQINRFVPLVLLTGGDSLSAFTQPQREALALGFLLLHRSGAALVTAFWGLWLLPFGILVMRSRRFPRVLGVLLLVAGCAYVFSSVTSIVLPQYRQVISKILMPLYFGEVPIILWLLIVGAKEPEPLAETARAG